MPEITLGAKVRMLRKRRGLKQHELAKKIGTARASYISQVERNEANPAYKTLQSLADALGVDLAELMSKKTEEIKAQNRMMQLLKLITDLSPDEKSILKKYL